jgi:hypothetical protein
MKRLLLVAAVLLAGYSYFTGQHGAAPNHAPVTVQSRSADQADAIIANAFANHKSNLQVSGQGVVVKLLPDDNSGSRHQRFLVKLANGQTLLVAHNIDLASRLSGLSEGDSIRFSGEYEWNEKGGVLHWTHRDPKGSHPSGWLQHHGQTYQ